MNSLLHGRVSYLLCGWRNKLCWQTMVLKWVPELMQWFPLQDRTLFLCSASWEPEDHGHQKLIFGLVPRMQRFLRVLSLPHHPFPPSQLFFKTFFWHKMKTFCWNYNTSQFQQLICRPCSSLIKYGFRGSANVLSCVDFLHSTPKCRTVVEIQKLYSLDNKEKLSLLSGRWYFCVNLKTEV